MIIQDRAISTAHMMWYDVV